MCYWREWTKCLFQSQVMTDLREPSNYSILLLIIFGLARQCSFFSCLYNLPNIFFEELISRISLRILNNCSVNLRCVVMLPGLSDMLPSIPYQLSLQLRPLSPWQSLLCRTIALSLNARLPGLRKVFYSIDTLYEMLEYTKETSLLLTSLCFPIVDIFAGIN